MASAQDHHPSPSPSEEDELPHPGPSKHPAVKRGTRACDRCRKIKSKCEVGTGDKCKNCEGANTLCTFQGPSFKRGPPKGYIHSIEQRWHQVECILATIMEAPRAQAIINDLRNDAFASAILDRVQAGPYGARSRTQQRDPSIESFYASFIQVPEHTPLRDDRRSRRQSRVSREIVSQDPTASATPTREWQDQLSRRLTLNNQWPYASSPVSATSRSSSSAGGDYSRTRRRIDLSSYGTPLQQQQNWDDLYTLHDTTRKDVDETAEAFGHLSVDQSKEFRYHGPASGLPLLAQSHRSTSDDHQVNRIWRFSANVDPEQASYEAAREEENIDVEMPPPDMQTYLLQLYFGYVHPFFPVIHKQDFLYHYNSLNPASPPPQARTVMNRHPMQRPCKMLLLSMFAIAARYSNRPEDHQMPDGSYVAAGQRYAQDAHHMKYQSSRPSTCQALLLLAIREFGMGAMDKGWLYSGMALRMAVDLGMNRNADSWTVDGKQSLFTDVEKQIRKHIWWSCCISDKLSAVWLGRPITFRANDYSTPLPDIDEEDENELWQPYPPGVLGDFSPQRARLMTCFREACHLSVIITDIMDKIYPVQASTNTPRRVLFEELESRLNKWLIELPDDLRYSPSDRQATVLPHVLMLHIEYNAAVLLLHRAFLPTYDEWVQFQRRQKASHGSPRSVSQHSSLQSDPLALKAFDVCAGAAVHISSMVDSYNERFGLERAPPFLCIYLQSAGIMHVVALGRRPSDPQASLGLVRCIEACKQIERLWPTATRLRTLLEGAKVHLDESKYSHEINNRRKRSVDDALGNFKNPDVSARDQYTMAPMDAYRGTGGASGSNWDSARHARMVAHSLGVGQPGAEASTSFYPGYQWWPSQLVTTDGLSHVAFSTPMDVPSVSAPVSYSALPGYAHIQPPRASHPSSSSSSASQPQQAPPPPPHPPPQSGMQAQEPFTFDQGHLSQEFIQGVHYPSFHFDRFGLHTGGGRHEPGPPQ